MLKKLPITKNTSTTKDHSERGDFFIRKEGQLTLKDGSVWKGEMPLWQTGSYSGEVVFTTGMTGYVESLSDPSYSNQILVFTYPLIGNYGVQPHTQESDSIRVSGVIISDIAMQWSHTDGVMSLLEWLKFQDIPVLNGVDTRALTRHLRSHGTLAGAIHRPNVPVGKLRVEATKVQLPEPVLYNEAGKKTVILVDCGAKENILRSLVAMGLCVKRVPYDYDYSEENYDGVLLSNGPGDPTDYQATIAIARKAMKNNKSMFGICLGSQIMALAGGAITYKLPFGHRGHNQPCLEVVTQHGYITSQNHGYAVDETSLPKDWQVTFRNLNDGSVEGISHVNKPFFAVQFHPEAAPGPTDSAWLFTKFYEGL